MKICFFREFGNKKEIGYGHLYRVRELSKILQKRGHKVSIMDDGILMSDIDTLVIDHIFKQSDLIKMAKSSNIKTVLIDGVEEDALIADISISAFVNKNAQYRGVKYISFPITVSWDRYRPYKKSNDIFVGMGGFDANNLAEMVAKILKNFNLNALIAKSANHDGIDKRNSNVGIYDSENYYDAFNDCLFAITNGGLTMFQCLYWGLPTISIAQYDHQECNINGVQHCCLPSKVDEDSIRFNIKLLLESEYLRRDLSRLSQYYVDGKGSERICNIIGGVNAV